MKDHIRKKMLILRNSLTQNEMKAKSKRIKHKLFSTEEFGKADTVLFYVSAGSEVHTHDIVEESLNSKRVAVPIASRSVKTLSISEIKSLDGLGKGAFGILEPKNVLAVSPQDLNLVVVPGIAFDEKGNRIGHGHGYFDRFLKDVPAAKIALAYEAQIVEEIPASENDVKVDFIVTEKRVIRCGV